MFWEPLLAGTYNSYNTVLYAILFGALALYVVYPGVKKLGLEFDREFFMAVAPYVFLAGVIGALGSNWGMYSPPMVFSAVLAGLGAILVLSKQLENRTGIGYYMPVMFAGLALLGVALTRFSFNPGILDVFLPVTFAWAVVGYAVLKTFQPNLLRLEFVLPVAAHYLDASTTVAVLSMGGTENQVLAGYFVSMLGPYGIFVLKTLVIVPLVYYIEKSFRGEEKNYYLFLIAALGFAIATRNFFLAV